MAIVLAAMLMAQGCVQPILGEGSGASSSDGMDADVRIVSHPEGGTGVLELACIFEVTEVPGSGNLPIPLYVSWTAPCGTHKTESFLFEGGRQVFESLYSEGGYPIGMTFWATITWTDSRGPHTVVTDVAVPG